MPPIVFFLTQRHPRHVEDHDSVAFATIKDVQVVSCEVLSEELINICHTAERTPLNGIRCDDLIKIRFRVAVPERGFSEDSFHDVQYSKRYTLSPEHLRRGFFGGNEDAGNHRCQRVTMSWTCRVKSMSDELKSAYELAMEKLRSKGEEQKLTEDQKAEIAEVRSRFQAKLAELEIRQQGEVQELQLKGDFENLQKREQEYVRDRERIREEMERQIQKIREGAS